MKLRSRLILSRIPSDWRTCTRISGNINRDSMRHTSSKMSSQSLWETSAGYDSKLGGNIQHPDIAT
jgi:hypothetical protein